MSRATTCYLMDLVDEGYLDAKDLLSMALNWMSEQDVVELAEANCLIPHYDEDEEEED